MIGCWPAVDGQQKEKSTTCLKFLCLIISCQYFFFSFLFKNYILLNFYSLYVYLFCQALFSFIYFQQFRFFGYVLWLALLHFYGIPEYTNDWASVSTSVSWAPFLLCLCFLLLLCFCIILLYFFYIIPFDACFFSNATQKGVVSVWDGSWGRFGKSREKGNYNHDVLCEKRICLQWKLILVLQKSFLAFYLFDSIHRTLHLLNGWSNFIGQ